MFTAQSPVGCLSTRRVSRTSERRPDVAPAGSTVPTSETMDVRGDSPEHALSRARWRWMTDSDDVTRSRGALGSPWSIVALLVGALIAATVVAAVGPEDTVICGEGHALNRLAQAIMQPLGAGHIDGPAATYCVVPSTVAWLLAGVVLLAGVIAVVLVARRARRRVAVPGRL
jgi:hypothetical protein